MQTHTLSLLSMPVCTCVCARMCMSVCEDRKRVSQTAADPLKALTSVLLRNICRSQTHTQTHTHTHTELHFLSILQRRTEVLNKPRSSYTCIHSCLSSGPPTDCKVSDCKMFPVNCNRFFQDSHIFTDDLEKRWINKLLLFEL